MTEIVSSCIICPIFDDLKQSKFTTRTKKLICCHRCSNELSKCAESPVIILKDSLRKIFENGSLRYLSYRGRSLPHNLYSLKILVCYNLKELPYNIVPGLKELHSYSPDLKFDHVYFRLLYKLVCPGSNMTSLPDAPLLRHLNIRHSKIDRVPPRRIHFVSSEHAWGHYLRYLDVSDTNVDVLPNTLISLQELYCNNTNIKEVPLEYTKLKILQCSYTLINTLPDTLESLEFLKWNGDSRMGAINSYLDYKLYYIPDTFKNLKVLISNNIREVPDTFTGTYLNIYNSYVNTLTEDMCKNLRYLNCSMTYIKEIKPLHNLRFLDCSSTNIKDISSAVNLKHLECANTEIKTIEHIKNLKYLDYITIPVDQSISLSSTMYFDKIPMSVKYLHANRFHVSKNLLSYNGAIKNYSQMYKNVWFKLLALDKILCDDLYHAFKSYFFKILFILKE